MNSSETRKHLLEGLDKLPDNWALTPVNKNKAPYERGWPEKPRNKAYIRQHIERGSCKAVGVLCGVPSGGLLFLDHDGGSCDGLVEKLSKQSLEEALPQTVSVTSGRIGRYQAIYQVPQEYWGVIETRKIPTGSTGEDGKQEQLEFRWSDCQSVVIGDHPTTSGYQWVIPPGAIPVAIAPLWMMDQMLVDPPRAAVQTTVKELAYGRISQAIKKAPSWRQFERDFRLPWSNAVPLKVCLSKANRALLDSGATEGGRNNGGATLARDLLGVMIYLQGVGQCYDGDPRDLFEQYCDRCSPSIPNRERESIWKSAQRDNPGPALSPDQIEGCIKGWAWRELQGNASAGPTTVSDSETLGGAAGADTPKTRLLTLEQVRQQIEQLVIEGTGEANIELELVKLGRASGVAPRTLQGIYHALLRETERDESTQDAIAAFDDLLKASGQTCDVGVLLPSLAGPLGHYAKAFNQEPVTFALPLLTVAASLLSPETDLVIGGVTDYRLSPVLWGGLVAEPGSIKTPVYNAILKPLVFRQVAAKDEYERQLEEYEAEVKNCKALGKEEARQATEPKEPKLRQYYVDSATTEAVQRIVTSQTDKGVAVAVDELSGFFHGFNQYKSGGKGSDRDFWKSAADGGAVKIDRVSGTQFAAKTSISVTGTVQPEVLGALMGAGDPDGFWSRFLWVRLPLNRLPAPGDGSKVDLTNLLHSIYRTLEEFPTQSFYLSSEANATWRRWHEWTEDRRLGTDTPVERVLYPKYRDRAGRVALVAHCLEYAGRGLQPPADIPNSTLEAAIAFVTFCLGQTRLLYSEIGLTSELTGDLLKVHDYLKRKGEPLTVADLGRANLFPPVRKRDGRKERNPKNRRNYLLPLLDKLVKQGYLSKCSEKLYSLTAEPKSELVECEVEPKLSDNSTDSTFHEIRGSGIENPRIEWLSESSLNGKEKWHSSPQNGNERDRTPQPPPLGGSLPVERFSGHSTNGNGHKETIILNLAEDLLTEAALAEIDQLFGGGNDG